MRRVSKVVSRVVLVSTIVFVLAAPSVVAQSMAPYPAHIDYKETITTIIDDQGTTFPRNEVLGLMEAVCSEVANCSEISSFVC